MKRFLIVISAGLMLGGCSALFFHPHETHVRTPDVLGLAYRDVWFDSMDGTELHAWLLPARGQALGTVLFFHGNAENISTHISSVSWLPERQFNQAATRGPSKGEGVDKAAFDKMLDEYYQCMGWNTQTGMPMDEKLKELGIQKQGCA